jgi:hypothetical protein
MMKWSIYQKMIIITGVEEGIPMMSYINTGLKMLNKETLEMQCPECESYFVKPRTLKGKEYGICTMCNHINYLDRFYQTAMEKYIKRQRNET